MVTRGRLWGRRPGSRPSVPGSRQPASIIGSERHWALDDQAQEAELVGGGEARSLPADSIARRFGIHSLGANYPSSRRERFSAKSKPMIKQYDAGKHCVFYHRHHIVWSTKYRFKVLRGDPRLRIRKIIRQVCAENDVEIIKSVLPSDHVQVFVSMPPKLDISDLVRKMKGRSSRKVQQEFPQIRKRYWVNGSGAGVTFRQPVAPQWGTWCLSTSNSTSPILPASACNRSVCRLRCYLRSIPN